MSPEWGEVWGEEGPNICTRTLRPSRSAVTDPRDDTQPKGVTTATLLCNLTVALKLELIGYSRGYKGMHKGTEWYHLQFIGRYCYEKGFSIRSCKCLSN